MIKRLAGTLVQVNDEGAVIDCNGVGYGVRWTLYTRQMLCCDLGHHVVVFVHHAISEQSQELFAFAPVVCDETGNTGSIEMRLFERLLKCSRVGPAKALKILSSARDPVAFEEIALLGDLVSLQRLDGVGAETAKAIAKKFQVRGVVRKAG